MARMNRIPTLVYPAAILSMVFWGMSFVWSTQVFRYYDPITTIQFRLILSSGLLFVILRLAGILERIQKEHVRPLLLSALFNPFLYFIGENYGLKLTTPTISAVVIATIPVVTPVFAFFFLRERLTVFNYMGILLSFSGVVVMLVNRNLDLDVPMTGMLFLGFAVLTGIGYSIFLKKLTEHYSPLTIITYQNMIGTVYFLPLFFTLDYRKFLSVTPNLQLLTALLQLAVFASSGAYILYTYAIKHLGVSKANVYTNLIPVITAIFSFHILQEEFTLRKLLGILIVIAGVFLAQVRNRKSEILVK